MAWSPTPAIPSPEGPLQPSCKCLGNKSSLRHQDFISAGYTAVADCYNLPSFQHHVHQCHYCWKRKEQHSSLSVSAVTDHKPLGRKCTSCVTVLIHFGISLCTMPLLSGVVRPGYRGEAPSKLKGFISTPLVRWKSCQKISGLVSELERKSVTITLRKQCQCSFQSVPKWTLSSLILQLGLLPSSSL